MPKLQSMKNTELIVDTFAVTVGVASSVMMAWVFYNEAFRHLGVVMIEPNIDIAAGELIIAVFGTVALFGGFLWRARKRYSS